MRDVVKRAQERCAPTGESFDRLTRVTAIAVNGVLVNTRKGMMTRLADGARVALVMAAAV